MEQVVITPDLNIHHGDLMLTVDFGKPFILRDVLRASVRSTVLSPQEIGEMVHCDFIEELWEEADSSPYDPPTDDPISYILLTTMIETFITDEGTAIHESFWDMSGYRPKTKSLVSLNMLSTFNLSDLPIRLSGQTEWHTFRKKNIQSKYLDFCRPPTLLEMMHAIYWHLGLFGAPSKRSEMIDQFVDAIKGMYLTQGKYPTVSALKRTLKESD